MKLFTLWLSLLTACSDSEVVEITDPVSYVMIEAAAGHVSVEAVDRSGAAYSHADGEVTAHVDGGVLTLTPECLERLGAQCETGISVEIPTTADLQVLTVRGTISVEAAGAELRLASETGDITGSSLRPTVAEVISGIGSIDLRVVERAGALMVQVMESAHVHIETPAGEYGALRLAADNGEVHVEGVEAGDGHEVIEVWSNEGDIAVTGI